MTMLLKQPPAAQECTNVDYRVALKQSADELAKARNLERRESLQDGGSLSYNWIGVDFDGTLAHYEHWVDLLDLGEPIWPMVYRVQAWLAEGKNVKVFTARACAPYVSKIKPNATFDDVAEAIGDWTSYHIGERLPITCVKDRWMIELWDDRAVQVEPNTGEPTTIWVSRA